MAYQPYGQSQAAPPMQQARPKFLAYGITYMAVRGGVLLLMAALFMFLGAALMSMGSGSSRGGGPPPEAGAVMGIIILVLVVWLAYVIAAGVMAIKGIVASIYMGFVDAGITTILAFIGLAVGDQPAGAFCWLVPNAAIITLGIFALRQRYARPTQPYGQPAYGQPAYGQPVYGQPAYGQPAYGAPQPAGYGAPSPQYRAGPQNVPMQPVAPQPPAVTSAVVPSPKMAALSILALAASVDPDISQQALERARVVALKLLGPAAQMRIQRQLAQPVAVMDVDNDLMQHTVLLNQQANDAMKGNVVKAAEYVLRGPNGIEGLGEQFMATLRQQLGM